MAFFDKKVTEVFASQKINYFLSSFSQNWLELKLKLSGAKLLLSFAAIKR